MPTLFVMRHAKSAWDTGAADHERPLNDRGRRQALAAASFLADDEVDRVLCSTSKRTRQTLQRLIDGGFSAGEITFHEEIYASGLGDIMPLFQLLPDDVETTLLIGHWPGVEDLVSSLAVLDCHTGWDRVLSKFVTSAIATLQFDGSWSALAPQTATLVDFVTPGRD